MKLGFLRYILSISLLLPLHVDAIQSASTTEPSVSEAPAAATIEQLKDLIRKNPASADERIKLSKLYYLNEQYENAEKEAFKARSLGLDDYFSNSLLVRSKIQLEKYFSAEKLLKKMDAVTPEQSSDKYYLLGSIEESQKSLVAALKHYQKSLENYLHPRSILGIARVSLAQKEYQSALDHIDKLDAVINDGSSRIELGLVVKAEAALDNKTLSEGALIKAKVLSEQSEYSKAITYFDKVLAFESNNIEAKLGKIKSQIVLNKYEESKLLVEELILSHGLQPEVLFLRSILFLQDDNYFDAAMDAEQVLLVSPSHYPSIYISGLAYFMLGNYEQSALKLAKYVQSNRQADNARIMLAASYFRLGSPQRTLSTLKRLLNDDVEDPGILVLAGNSYLQLGHIDKGEAYIDKVLGKLPSTSLLAKQLAASKFISSGDDSSIRNLRQKGEDPALDALMVFSYINKGQYEVARDFLNRKNLESPENVDSRLLAALVENAAGNYELALQMYDEVLSIDLLNASALMRKAELSIRLGKVDAAQQSLDKLLQMNPNHEAAHLSSISLEELKGNIKKAKEMRAKLTQKFPGSYQAVRSVVIAYLKEGSKKKALEEAQRFYRRNPDSLNAAYLNIEVLNALDLRGDAKSKLNKLIDKEPDRISHKIFLAQILSNKGQAYKAVDLMESVLTTEPNNVPSLILISELLLDDGQVDKALAYVNRADALAPRNSLVLKLKGDLAWYKQNYAEAVMHYETAYPSERSKELLYRLFKSYGYTSGDDQSMGFLQQHVRIYPDDQNGLQLLAGYFLKIKELDLASDLYVRLLKLQPNNPVIWNNLATLFHQRGDKRALEYARKAYELAPDRAEIIDTLGWILVSEGDELEGVELLRKAVAASKDDKLIRYHYAVGLSKIGTENANNNARKLLKTLLKDKDLGSLSKQMLMNL